LQDQTLTLDPPTKMATSMAAAIAASLPAPTAAAPVVERPTYEAIPASMSKVVDMEVDVPITRVQIDALVRSSFTLHRHYAREKCKWREADAL
jgi:hypothetical protein